MEEPTDRADFEFARTTHDHFFEPAQRFIEAFDRWIEPFSSKVRADHIGYKCVDSEEFARLRSLLERESVFVYQSIISQRRIAVIKLLRPLQTVCGDIAFLELSDQKPDGSQVSGFDHLEVYPHEGTVEELLAEFQNAGVTFEKVTRPHHVTYDRSLMEGFKVRLEAESLIEKIKATEMV